MEKSKTGLKVLLATCFSSIGYYLSSLTPLNIVYYDVVIISLSIFSSNYIANAIVYFLAMSRYGRMALFREAWVEGYWYWYTRANENDTNPIIRPGIMYLHYIGSEMNLRAVVLRPDPQNCRYFESSHSELALLRESDTRYINYASIPAVNAEAKAFAVGRFLRTGAGLFPDSYEGSVIIDNEAVYRRQYARKMRVREVRKLKKQHGDLWVHEAIKNA